MRNVLFCICLIDFSVRFQQSMFQSFLRWIVQNMWEWSGRAKKILSYMTLYVTFTVFKLKTAPFKCKVWRLRTKYQDCCVLCTGPLSTMYVLPPPTRILRRKGGEGGQPYTCKQLNTGMYNKWYLWIDKVLFTSS